MLIAAGLAVLCWFCAGLCWSLPVLLLCAGLGLVSAGRCRRLRIGNHLNKELGIWSLHFCPNAVPLLCVLVCDRDLERAMVTTITSEARSGYVLGPTKDLRKMTCTKMNMDLYPTLLQERSTLLHGSSSGFAGPIPSVGGARDPGPPNHMYICIYIYIRTYVRTYVYVHI